MSPDLIHPSPPTQLVSSSVQTTPLTMSSFMNKVFQLASNNFYSTLGIITPVFIVFYRAFMCLLSSRRANLCALAWLVVLKATLIPAEGAALATICPAACLNSLEHYCKEVFRKSECRHCRVTCNNQNNWNECEENCKDSQFYPGKATTAGEPFVAAPSVTPDASNTSSPVVSNTVGGPTGFERGSEYYPVDATTTAGELSTAVPSETPTVTTSLIDINTDVPQSVPVWCWIMIGVAVVIIVVVIIMWKKKGGCTGSPGVTGDTVFYEAVDSKVTTTFVCEKNSTVPVQPSEESNQAEALIYQTAHRKNSTVPVHPSEESNQADGKAISNRAKGRGTAKPDCRNGPRTPEAADSETTTYMVVPPDPMKTEMHIVDPDRSGE